IVSRAGLVSVSEGCPFWRGTHRAVLRRKESAAPGVVRAGLPRQSLSAERVLRHARAGGTVRRLGGAGHEPHGASGRAGGPGEGTARTPPPAAPAAALAVLPRRAGVFHLPARRLRRAALGHPARRPPARLPRGGLLLPRRGDGHERRPV